MTVICRATRNGLSVVANAASLAHCPVSLSLSPCAEAGLPVSAVLVSANLHLQRLTHSAWCWQGGRR